MPASRALLDAKLAKAEEFLLIAEFASDDYFDVAISNAAIAGIHAADVLLAVRFGITAFTRSEHEQAARDLERAGQSTSARHLRRLLSVKNTAQYSAKRLRSTDADEAVKNAGRLVDAAKKSVRSANT